MPYRAVISFLRVIKDNWAHEILYQCPIGRLSHFYIGYKEVEHSDGKYQCPIGRLSHFYGIKRLYLLWSMSINALSGGYLISTVLSDYETYDNGCINALSGGYLISTPNDDNCIALSGCINALSGGYLISTNHSSSWRIRCRRYQCPIGRLSHFYVAVKKIPWWMVGYQCPIGRLSHFYKFLSHISFDIKSINALSGGYLISTNRYFNRRGSPVVYQCPIGRLSHFYTLIPANTTENIRINALSGGYLISTIQNLYTLISLKLYQCPIGRLSHFYAV